MKIKEIVSALLIMNLTIPASIAQGEIIRSDEIIKWDYMTAPKGFILSNYLYHQQNCALIWEKQLPEFVLKNPHVEDPDVIAAGTRILVQTCKAGETLAQENEPNQQPAENNGGWTQSEVNPDKSEPSSEKKIDTAGDHLIDPPYLHLYAGFLTENEKEEKIDSAYGIGVTGDLFKFLGYHIRGLGSAGAIFLQNEVIFKTSPGKTRGHLIFGFGNRLGLQNRDLDRLNKGVDSFTYGGLGVEMNPHSKYRFGFDVTTNFGTYRGLNLGVSAQKRFGEDYWLGLYGEIQSSQSVIDSGDDRRFFTGGLKLSF